MLRVAVCLILFLAVSLSQVPETQFEVASIRPSRPDEVAAGWSGCQDSPGLVRCTNVTLKRCIVGAYVVGADRVLSGPDWIDTDHFQITARTNQPIGVKDLMAM